MGNSQIFLRGGRGAATSDVTVASVVDVRADAGPLPDVVMTVPGGGGVGAALFSDMADI